MKTSSNNRSVEFFKAWLESQKEEICNRFFEFLKIPSISTDPSYRLDIYRAHDFLKAELLARGFDVKSIKTPRYPVLLAKLPFKANLPTVVIYNHYDVQPVDPLEKWSSPPFEPTLSQEGEVFARGAQDNKGQLWATLAGLDALAAYGDIPCNITWCIEGEEESGSIGLNAVLKQIAPEIKADALFVIDLTVPSLEKPALVLGCRGNITLTLELKGSKNDLHSGLHGGIAYNPLHGLVEMLSALRDRESGKILIEGFYDDVVMPEEEERELLNLEFDAQKYEMENEASACGGEKEFSPLESAWLRPTLEINGLCGGYAGDGFKTVIPSMATAKISCRLVSKQEPQKIRQLLEKRLRELTPKGLELTLKWHGSGGSCKSNPKSKAFLSVKQAYEEVLEKPCHAIMSGGSIPVIAAMSEKMGSDVVFFGLGLDSDNIHAPNEHYGLERLLKLAAIIARSLEVLAGRI